MSSAVLQRTFVEKQLYPTSVGGLFPVQAGEVMKYKNYETFQTKNQNKN